MNDYDLVHEVYFKHKTEIDDRAENSRFKLSIKVLYRFYLKIEELTKSLELLETANCFYSSQGLARILDEHYLVASYIWVKTRVENNEKCAKEYFEDYAIYEFMKQKNYDSKLDKSYDSKKSPLQNFILKVPESIKVGEVLQEADIIELNKKANQFDIRKILIYMQESLDPNDPYKPFHIMIHDICTKYNKRSTFVHGGRLGDNQMFDQVSETEKKSRLIENVAYGKTFSYQLLNFIMILLIIDNNDFIKTYRPIWESMMHKYNLNSSV